ncbi:hypothetical protein R1flu_016386 [Riccia fluitans]|uniref:Protein unc-13 homolog n=1 Tax=Riccia fluitans TaxID=41844 RepID=A0ABD1YLX3_9MARC
MAPNAPDQLMRVLSLSDAPVDSPFPELEIDLSEDDLRETAYEILVAACGHGALSARTQTKPKTGLHSVTSLTHRGLRKAAHALGSMRDKPVHPASKDKKRPPTTAEIVQYQMRIDEESETRIRRALLRAFSHHVGKPVESMLVPLELLQCIGPRDFTNPAHYQRWRRRQLRILEAGLLVYPAIRSEGGDTTLSQRLQKMLDDLQNSSTEVAKNTEGWNALKIAALAKAGRSVSGEHPSPKLHWADGYPLNVHLYLALLLSTFDTLEEGQLIDEIEDVLEMFKKTWGILGINEVLHDLCFMWVLFNQFIAAGQIETDLLTTAQAHMKELAALVDNHVVVHGAQAVKDSLTTIHSWCERRLLAYHETFPQGAQEVMEALLAIGLSAGRLLAEGSNQGGGAKRKDKNLSNFESDKVELYIRSSLKAAFAQMMETTDTRRRSFKKGDVPVPPLAALAADIGQLAADERAKYTPVLKKWNVCAGGIAAATLHACFGREVKQFLTGLQKVGPDVLQVLKAAQLLEEVLVQIAVEDAVDAEDGGKSLIREMQPYDCESFIEKLSKEWLQNALVNLIEWVGRNIEHEEWKPKSTREGYAHSAVEILSIIDETMEAFFGLPFSTNPQYVEQLVSGVESAIQLYCQKTLAGTGKKERYVPSLPSLTRYDPSEFKKIGQQLQKSRIVAPSDGEVSITRNEELVNICVRINTLHHLSTEMEYLGKRLKHGWQKEVPSRTELQQNGQQGASSFTDVARELDNGVQFLIELVSYRVVFFDLRSVFWEGLYAGGVKDARIGTVIDQLDPLLGVVAETVAASLRNRVVGALMKASMDCLVLVLLAGGPSRAFSLEDAGMLEEDLFELTDLFTAGGDGLPEALVTSATRQIHGILSLFTLNTAYLIQKLREVYPEADAGTTSMFKSNAAVVPRTTGVEVVLTGEVRQLSYRFG